MTKSSWKENFICGVANDEYTEVSNCSTIFCFTFNSLTCLTYHVISFLIYIIFHTRLTFVLCAQNSTPSHPIMTTPTCNHPSAYAAPCIINVSNCAPIGTTAPCRTGFARIGVRRLGNRAGSRACRAMPRVCEGAIGD